jgi:phytol kinase
VGVGVIKDEAAVKAMSRSGDPREILRGPTFYGLIFVICTVLFWYDTPIGIVALMQLCGGDGLADILGRRYGRTRIPWNRHKSWMGSLGMFLGGLLLSVLILFVYVWMGIFSFSTLDILPLLLLISIAATLVETLPFKDVDNITVTLSAVILGYIFF